ncbi:hypothetical protein [Phage f2b1]|nr:hypothetical protein [Phage f2b1]
MASKKATVPAHLNCGECNNPVQILRVRGRMKEKGHVKDMWCYKCKKETKHIEIKDKERLSKWFNQVITEGAQLHG